MELIKVGEKTYYIKNATNIGVYKIDEENVLQNILLWNHLFFLQDFQSKIYRISSY